METIPTSFPELPEPSRTLGKRQTPMFCKLVLAEESGNDLLFSLNIRVKGPIRSESRTVVKNEMGWQVEILTDAH